MSVYSLKTALNTSLGELVCKLSGEDSEACRLVQDNIPQATEVQEFLEPQQIEDSQLSKIIKSRLDRLNRERNFGLLSVGDPDYLFSEFLERGQRCSDAVCLLERGFWFEDLIEKIKNRPTKEFPEVLRRLSKKLRLRVDKEPGERHDRWIDKDKPDKKVAEVLEDPVIKEKLDELRKRVNEETNESEKRRKGIIYIPFATGFLVGKNYLMTNFHVFNDLNKEEINNFVAKFRYERNALGENVNPIKYQLNPEVCISNEELDFTIVGVKAREDYQKDRLNFSEAGENFGWLPMLADPTLVAPPIKKKQLDNFLNTIKHSSYNQISRTDFAGEPVFIIQHPRGTRKRIVLFNNSIQQMYQKFFKYEADTDFGSSGSLVVNQRWQLVGLHHSMLAKLDIKGDQQLEVQGNLGTRMCAIVDFLKANKHNRVAQELLGNPRYVVESNKIPLKGTINILVGHQRQNAPSLEHATKEVDIAQFLLERISAYAEQSIPVKDILSESKTCYETGLESLSSLQNYQNGDIAVDIRTNVHPEISTPSTRVTIYYGENRPELKAYADIVLSKMKVTGIIQPVKAETDPSLKFCDVVNMPALVITFDFDGVSFEQVKQRIFPPPQWQMYSVPLYLMVANALKAWVKVISPIGWIN